MVTDNLELLLVHRGEPSVLARALAQVETALPELIAVVVQENHANTSIIRLFDGAGGTPPQDLGDFAAALSAGGRSAGVARIDPFGEQRAWRHFEDGQLVATYTADDEPYVPHDEDGFPDLDISPRRRADGVPEGWRRLRSCLDLGMQRLASCRFTPVSHALDALLEGRATNASAYVLVSGGRPVRPPAEVPVKRVLRGDALG